MIFTQSNEKTALNFLAQNDWKLEVATDKFFQNPELYAPNIKGALDKRKLEQLYNRYRGVQLTCQCRERIFGFNVCTAPSTQFEDHLKCSLAPPSSLFLSTCPPTPRLFFPPSPLDPHDVNKIGIDGIQQFCDDLMLDPASISVLLIAWKFRAATQCEFSKQEFMDGMSRQG